MREPNSSSSACSSTTPSRWNAWPPRSSAKCRTIEPVLFPSAGTKGSRRRGSMSKMVRQVVGYDRFVGEHAYRQLTELYRALRLYVNCFQPSMKLLSKQREGKKVRYVYDPAKTPLQRLLLSGVLPAEMQQELLEVAHALDPIRLLHQLEQLQQAVFRCAVGCPPFISS